MGSREQNFYDEVVRRYGFEEAARAVQDLYLRGRDAGVGTLIVSPPAWSFEERRKQLRPVVELAA